MNFLGARKVKRFQPLDAQTAFRVFGCITFRYNDAGGDQLQMEGALAREIELRGDIHQLGERGDAHLSHHLTAVRLNGYLADAEFVRHFAYSVHPGRLDA